MARCVTWDVYLKPTCTRMGISGDPYDIEHDVFDLDPLSIETMVRECCTLLDLPQGTEGEARIRAVRNDVNILGGVMLLLIDGLGFQVRSRTAFDIRDAARLRPLYPDMDLVRNTDPRRYADIIRNNTGVFIAYAVDGPTDVAERLTLFKLTARAAATAALSRSPLRRDHLVHVPRTRAELLRHRQSMLIGATG